MASQLMLTKKENNSNMLENQYICFSLLSLLPLSSCAFAYLLLEVFLLLDILNATVHVPKAAGQINLKKTGNEDGLFLFEVTWEFEIALGDFLEHLHLSTSFKGRTSTTHLVREHTNSPPIYSMGVAFVDNNFRC
eukprot:m.18950 g.18950  ORF g.18950 m.18950 type:complete len:135 (-) comp12133_c0_seq2:706-1110(-)